MYLFCVAGKGLKMACFGFVIRGSVVQIPPPAPQISNQFNRLAAHFWHCAYLSPPSVPVAKRKLECCGVEPNNNQENIKDEVLNGLLTARALFTSARHQCHVRDRHIASAGLTILQDAFELVLYSCLLEVGVDGHPWASLRPIAAPRSVG